jgi:hypothetical protein
LAERHVCVAVFGGLVNVLVLKIVLGGVGEFAFDLGEVSEGSEHHNDVGSARRDVGNFDRDQAAELSCFEPLVVVLL